ncbi:hypothetical protein [Paractinoplanes toevensis]|uniref:Uncharacterized protein n=1 Tax=Paractinoplanes toevensis TaxID=571911 RepID=A0A919T3A2_9ACTN|nr:hypothetical protein [Actinoplanes toevensis]GIM88463.1 hypothetical protein Ato02nite_002560 [Actinoplanes toevensis]
MQILVKIIVTAIAGGLTYLLTNITEQPKIWQLTMSVFVAGIVLVVQFLIENAEQARRTQTENAEQAAWLKESVGAISAAATHLATAEGHLDRQSLSRLIDATSMTSFDRYRGFVDEGEFWASDLGLRYLDRQRRAIERKVQIRRLFLLDEDATDTDQIKSLLEPHQKIGVETRTLLPEDVDFLYQNDLADFIVFDQKISYEFHTARSVRKNVTPQIDSVALVVNPLLVKRRQDRFEELWKAARADITTKGT